MTGGPGPDVRGHLRRWGYDALQLIILVVLVLAALAERGWHL